MKVETHNHPTAISPFPGAATGSGGEIRDEGATGIGAKPKVGLTGFSVSNLRIPGMVQPWETDFGKPGADRLRARHHDRGALGCRGIQQRVRPTRHLRVLPHFRADGARGRCVVIRGYHKPIMIAGGLGQRAAQRCGEARGRGGRAAGRARRPGDADRSRRRRRLLGRQRTELFRFGFRVGAARQRGNSAPRSRGHRPMLGAGRGQSDPADPRRRCGRTVERAARGDRAQPAAAAESICARFRAPSPSFRRWRSGATRRRSATFSRSSRRASSASRHCASASAVRLPWWGRSPATDASR